MRLYKSLNYNRMKTHIEGVKEVIRIFLNITLFVVILFVVFSLIVGCIGLFKYGKFELGSFGVVQMVAVIIASFVSRKVVKGINDSKLWTRLFRN